MRYPVTPSTSGKQASIQFNGGVSQDFAQNGLLNNHIGL
jgi:hypothetical protein